VAKFVVLTIKITSTANNFKNSRSFPCDIENSSGLLFNLTARRRNKFG